MSDIELVRSHAVSISEAKARVQKIADELAPEYDLSSEWHGNTLHFQRSGLHGQTHVTASHIRLVATLGFLMKPLKNALVDRIERKFQKVFPEPAPRRPAQKDTKPNSPVPG